MNNLHSKIIDYNNRRLYFDSHSLSEDSYDSLEIAVWNLFDFLSVFRFGTNPKEFKEALSELKDDFIANINNTNKLGSMGHLVVYYAFSHKKNMSDRMTGDSAKEVIIETLLEHGLDPNLTDEYGYTFVEGALFGKLGRSRNSFVPNSERFILNLITKAKENGFDVNHVDNNGNTIVHTAIASPYYDGDIVNLLITLGDDFVQTIRNRGKEIIEFIDYCINESKPLSGSIQGYDFKATEVEEKWKKRLAQQKDSIIDYIQTMTNPLAYDPNFQDELAELEDLIDSNLRLETFILGYISNNNITICKSTITFDEISRKKTQEQERKKSFIKQVAPSCYSVFGACGEEVLNLIINGYETVDVTNLLCYYGKKFDNPYPHNEPVLNKMIWLHEICLAASKKTQEDSLFIQLNGELPQKMGRSITGHIIKRELKHTQKPKE